MARIIVCVVLIYLSVYCNILNADENDNISDAIEKPSYKSPKPSGFAHLAEDFDNEEKFKNSWILSEAKKDDIEEDIAKYDGLYNFYIFFTIMYIFYINLI
jgi:calnexin